MPNYGIANRDNDDLTRNREHREELITEIRELIQANESQENKPGNHDSKNSEQSTHYHCQIKLEILNMKESATKAKHSIRSNLKCETQQTEMKGPKEKILR